jgi:hypothetical protein
MKKYIVLFAPFAFTCVMNVANAKVGYDTINVQGVDMLCREGGDLSNKYCLTLAEPNGDKYTCDLSKGDKNICTKNEPSKCTIVCPIK